MKLPSGREISNESLANITMQLASLAVEYESLGDARATVREYLEEQYWTPGEQGSEGPYTDDDIDAIISEVESMASDIQDKLVAFQKGIEDTIVNVKYPH